MMAMKKWMFFLLLAAGFSAHAQKEQSLKDLPYGGKLKKDSSGVVRKTDDLSTKIDTSTKKPIEPEKTKPVVAADPQKKSENAVMQNAAVNTTNTVNTEVKDTAAVTAIAPKENAAPAKTNTKIWKEYADSL